MQDCMHVSAHFWFRFMIWCPVFLFLFLPRDREAEAGYRWLHNNIRIRCRRRNDIPCWFEQKNQPATFSRQKTRSLSSIISHFTEMFLSLFFPSFVSLPFSASTYSQTSRNKASMISYSRGRLNASKRFYINKPFLWGHWALLLKIFTFSESNVFLARSRRPHSAIAHFPSFPLARSQKSLTI